MDTQVRTPITIFSAPQRLEVPLFQRPYVWEEERQWAPLWQDLRRMAEHQLAQPGSSAAHFLGAIVVQLAAQSHGAVQSASIIDGQQRLTTLQVVFDAVAGVLEVHELSALQGQLEALTHNPQAFVPPGDVPLKLRHSNRDRAAYEEVMLAEPPVAYDELSERESRITLCHRYFSQRVAQWLSEGNADTHLFERRAQALTSVLLQGLQLVRIELRADEDSQEIFETLNARGTPLTAADLIKNFVFQRLQAEGVDTARAYQERWPFDTPFWEKEVSVGRVSVSRSSLFLNQWLIAQIGEEVSPKSTFARFKHYSEHDTRLPMADMLIRIKHQARDYEAWTVKAGKPNEALDALELCVYRGQAADTEVLKPFLLWLTESDRRFSAASLSQCVQVIESWLVRRLLVRAPTADHGRVIADLIQSLSGVKEDQVVVRVTEYLGRLDAESTYWPDDEELRLRLGSESAYKRFRRGRLRMVLEAVEDSLRGYSGARSPRAGERVPRTGFPIEHLLPQKWKTHYGVEGLAAQIERESRVHRLGNLTLLTAALNSEVSNGPWLGEKGKRAKLEKHDVLLMNRRVRELSVAGWDEPAIDARTEELIGELTKIWPTPEGHVARVAAAVPDRIDEIGMPELVAGHLLVAGTVLSGSGGQGQAIVMANGELEVAGQRHASPTGACKAVTARVRNGWTFWRLPDGRKLKDLRVEMADQLGATEVTVHQ